ncbi:hypothetical protein VTP01DRAFT_6861 [Rhizomucor pusillus]|uniref:uncharacterized protein n=1 Tax=Rhizomucor pusillus TaxID=4840 RepID=UPI003742A7B6
MFHGIDLNPVFPQTNVPANIKFDVAKLGEPLPFPDNTFQFIHQRLVAIGLKAEEWDKALKEHIRILQPGGWLELNEGDLEMRNMGPKTHTLIHAYLEMTLSKNLIPLVARELKERLKNLQLQDVTEICVDIPMQDDADGQITLWDCLSPAFHNMQPYLSQINAAFKDDDYFAKFLKDIGDECREHKTTLRMYRVYGQKPANQ